MLLETWKKDIDVMKEKHASQGKKQEKGKKPEHVRITPGVLDKMGKKAKGLRVKNKDGKVAGEESTIVDVDGNTVTIAGPTGNLKKMSKTSVSSTKELD